MTRDQGTGGTVTDATGGVISGAQAAILNAETGVETMTETGISGAYAAPNMKPGQHNFIASAEGFTTAEANGLRLNFGSEISQSFAPEIGALTETVVVSAAQLQIQTTWGSVGSTVTTEQIQELPRPIRDIFNLLNLVPGAFRSGSNANISIGAGRTQAACSFIDGAFEVPDPYTLGNAGRTLPGIRVPSRMNFDVMLGKNSCWGERWRARFNWEACNFTNAPAFIIPNTALGTGGFGIVTATLPNSRRIMQFGLRITSRPSSALSLTGHRVGLT